MVAGIMIGREGSVGFPGKNIYPMLGRPLASYAMMAAKNSKYVDEVFLSTDSPRLRQIAMDHGVKVIERKPALATSKALAEDAFADAYFEAKKMSDRPINIAVLLFCNGATITSQTIDEGIEILNKNPEIDSAVTVSRYNMWSPIRARKVNAQGLLEPFVPLETFGPLTVFTCDRDSQGDVLFADMSASIVRGKCLENLESGVLPQRWMGKKIAPIYQEAGCDVDYEWQMPGVEYWLKKQGFTESQTPYDK